MKLYFAPNSRAVRSAWLLYELGIDDFEIEVHGLGSPTLRTDEYRKINPNGRIPVLEDGDVRVTESTAIAQYLAARHGNGKFVPDVASPEFPVFLQWLHYAEGMIMPPFNDFVIETLLLPPERRSEEHAKRAAKLVERALMAAGAHLDGRDYLAGDFTIADTITGHACIMAERIIKIDLAPHGGLKAYVDRLKERPAFKKADSLKE